MGVKLLNLFLVLMIIFSSWLLYVVIKVERQRRELCEVTLNGYHINEQFCLVNGQIVNMEKLP